MKKSSNNLLPTLTFLLTVVIAIVVYEQAGLLLKQQDGARMQMAAIWNPISAFLGISGETEQSRQQQVSNTNQNDDEYGFGEGFGLPDDYFDSTPDDPWNLGGSGQPSGEGQSNQSSQTSFVSRTSPQTTANISIDDLAPTFLCLPNPINVGETAILMWACRDSSDSSALTADDTSNPVDTTNDTIGTARVTPNGDTTYTLTCDKGTQSSCTVEVANPALAILTTPSSATRGQTVTISWKTKDTNACIVTSSDPNHQNFSRQGVEGDAVSPTLTRNTTFILTCETSTGTLEERSVSVGVN